MGRGRPKKYLDGVGRAHKTIYYPMTKSNIVIWNEFERICAMSENPSIYSRMANTRKNVFLRQAIYRAVSQNSKDNTLKELAITLLLRDINERIDNFNKDKANVEGVEHMEKISLKFLKGEFNLIADEGDENNFGVSARSTEQEQNIDVAKQTG